MDSSTSGEVMYFFQSTGAQFWENVQGLLTFIKDNFGHFLWRLLGIVLILILAQVVLKWVSRLTSRTMEKNRKLLSQEQSRRVDTLMTLVRSAARYLIYFVALLLILGQFGNSMAQNVLLAVGSIGGIAFGFGAQDLVQDVVTGLFMIFENQFSVGDYIQTEEATGTVEATALRVTYLRSDKGDQIIIPNGSIQRVVNYTRGSYIATIVVSTAYEADTRRVMEIMEDALAEYAQAKAELLEGEPVVRGITAFSASSVDITVACPVKPMKQWEVERGMRLAIKEEFDRRGIEFPYPRVVTIPWGEQASAPRPEVGRRPLSFGEGRPEGKVPDFDPDDAPEDPLEEDARD